MNARYPTISKLLILLFFFGLMVGGASVAGSISSLSTVLYGGWEELSGSATLGGISHTPDRSDNPSLAIDSNGSPIVAWHDDASGYNEIYVMRLEGSVWKAMDGTVPGVNISNNDGDSNNPSLALDTNGYPVVAWGQTIGGVQGDIHVKRWNGSAWVEIGPGSATLGGVSNTPNESGNPSLAIDPDGRPIVAWTETTTNMEIYVAHWNGSAWEAMDGTVSGLNISNSGGDSNNPSLAIDENGYPVIAWDEMIDGANSEIYVKRWNGTAWVEMKAHATSGALSASGGGVSDNQGRSIRPSLVIRLGMTAVAWQDDSGPGDYDEIYVKRWNGAHWNNQIGPHSASGVGISDNTSDSNWPSLAIAADGSPVIAWGDTNSSDSAIYFRQFNGLAWVEMGVGSATLSGISGPDNISDKPTLAVAADGRLILGWENRIAGGEPDIYARSYLPPTYGGWEEIGGSASDGGISGDSGISAAEPALAFDPDELPIVAWHDNTSGNNEIYLKRWNGSDWVAMGGSASDGGISASEGGSFKASLAVGTDGRPIVAWRDTVGLNKEIYLKVWNGSAWVAMDGSANNVNISNTPYDSDNPSLAIDREGRPIVAWSETSSGREVYVARWDGSAWGGLDNSASGNGISDSEGDTFTPFLAIDTYGYPVVAWAQLTGVAGGGDSEIYVKRWDGSIWKEMGSGSASGGGISANTGGSFRPSLAIGPDGTTVVAWEDNTGQDDFEIYVMQWDKQTESWQELGAGSDSGGGISDNNGDSKWPSLAFNPDGAPIIAWEDATNGNTAIYFRRWNGSDWIEEGSGSAEYGGVSGTPRGNLSLTPSLAASTNGRVMVVWEENANEAGESYIFARSNDLCFELNQTHTGQGDDPIATPANSPGCATGEYKAGVTINLAAQPAAGWQVAGWNGTDNDGSNLMTNMVTMPAESHTVSVRYSFPLFLPSVVDRSIKCFAGPNETDNNDYPVNVIDPLCPVAHLQGYKDQPDDYQDFFLLLPEQKGDIVITLSGNLNDVILLALYPGNCEVINNEEICDADTNHPIGKDSSSADGLLNVTYLQAPSGRYYIGILFKVDAQGGGAPYVLDVISPWPY